MAILLVMVMHNITVFEPWTLVDNLAHKAASFGWIGVDLFFCLSGFLITGILLDTKNSPSYFRTFFARRALRIFPLYFCFVATLAITAYFIVPQSPEAQRWAETQGWYWSYAVNFLIASEGTWAAGPLHSGHLWSLAIEEQFYLVWPIIVWKLSQSSLLRLCIVSFFAVLALRVTLLLLDVDPIAIFVMTPTRIDALLAGAAVAVLVRSGVRSSLRPIVIGAAPVLLAVILHKSTSQYRPLMLTMGLSGLAVAFAGLVHIVVERGNRVLSMPALTFFGRYSYGLYILHGFALWCVLELWPIAESRSVVIHWIVLRAIVAGALTVLMALASWHILEKRCLALKPNYETPPRDGAAVMAT